MTYQFIKSKLRIIDELHQLWDNFPLYRFLREEEWMRQKELEIAECLIDRHEFIEKARLVYKATRNEKEAKKKPR